MWRRCLADEALARLTACAGPSPQSSPSGEAGRDPPPQRRAERDGVSTPRSACFSNRPARPWHCSCPGSLQFAWLSVSGRVSDVDARRNEAPRRTCGSGGNLGPSVSIPSRQDNSSLASRSSRSRSSTTFSPPGPARRVKGWITSSSAVSCTASRRTRRRKAARRSPPVVFSTSSNRLRMSPYWRPADGHRVPRLHWSTSVWSRSGQLHVGCEGHGRVRRPCTSPPPAPPPRPHPPHRRRSTSIGRRCVGRQE